MAYALANGVPAHSGNLTPQLFDPQLRMYLYYNTVFTEIANNNHTSKIKNFGDKVTIRQLPQINIGAYAIGQGQTYQRPETPTLDFYVDKGASWGFTMNDVELTQTDIKSIVDQWASHAGKLLGEYIDKNALNDIYTSVDAANKGATAGKATKLFNFGVAGTPLSLTTSNIIQCLAQMKAALTEQNVPDDGNRWIVVPPWMTLLLMTSNLMQAYVTGDPESTLRSNKVGKILGFTIYESNQLIMNVADSAWNILFGHKISLAFATQLVKNENMRDPNDFGDLYRGLQVYGYKVIIPEAMGCVYAKPSFA